MPPGTEQAEFTEPNEADEQIRADVTVISSQASRVRTATLDRETGEALTAGKAFDQISADAYDVVIVPGGPVAYWLRADAAAVAFICASCPEECSVHHRKTSWRTLRSEPLTGP